VTSLHRGAAGLGGEADFLEEVPPEVAIASGLACWNSVGKMIDKCWNLLEQFHICIFCMLIFPGYPQIMMKKGSMKEIRNQITAEYDH